MRRLIGLALVAAGCSSSQTGVVVTLHGNVSGVDGLTAHARYSSLDVARAVPIPGGALTLPSSFFAALPDQALDVRFDVVATHQGTFVAEGLSDPVAVAPHRIAHADVDLAGGDMAVAAGPDLAYADFAGVEAIAVPYESVVLADGPVAYYRLDEASGDSAMRDSSGNHLDGSCGANVVRTAGLLPTTPGHNGALFDGKAYSASSICLVPRNPLLEPASAVSVEVWARLSAVGSPGAILLDYGDGIDPYILQQNGGDHPECYVNGAGGPIMPFAAAATFSNAVHHLVVTYDSATSLLNLYVDGRRSSASHSGAIDYHATTVGLALGNGGVPGSMGPQLAGELDEVAIYARALDQATVTRHCLAGGLTGCQ